MHYDRFDIVDAYYWFLSEYHDGQYSRRYARLSKITSYFSPSILAYGPDSENARAIYDELVAKENP